MKKKVGLIIIIIVSMLIGSGITVLNLEYLYNPIIFEKDYIINYDWSYYKDPLRIEYYYWDKEGGWTLVNTVQDKYEIKYIFKKLKENLHRTVSKDEYLLPEEKRGRFLYVVIRHMEGGGRGLILKQFKLYEFGNVADIGNMTYIKISDDLKELILRRVFDDEYVDGPEKDVTEEKASETNQIDQLN